MVWRRRDAPRRKNWFWKGCKPNFVCALRRRESFIYAADTRNPSAFAALERAAPWIPYLALHPTGFSVPRRLRFARCALTAPFHHHRRLAPEAVCFLWHCPSERLPTFLPSISRPYKPGLRGVAPCGVRTFLPRLAPGAILRPSKTIITVYQPGRFLKQNKEAPGGRDVNETGTADIAEANGLAGRSGGHRAPLQVVADVPGGGMVRRHPGVRRGCARGRARSGITCPSCATGWPSRFCAGTKNCKNGLTGR